MLIGLIGIGVTVAIALIQSFRAGSTAKAAKIAAEGAQRQIAGASLLIRTADLENLERRLRKNALEGHRNVAREAILDWRRGAEEYVATLKASGSPAQQANEHLALALGVVEIALDDLADPEIEPERACRALLQHASRACGASRGLATDMMLTPTGGPKV